MPTRAFSNICTPPSNRARHRELSHFSSISVNGDLGSAAQRPRNNAVLSKTGANRVVEWLSSQVDERAELSMDRQDPGSTIGEDDDPFVDRRFFRPEYTFSRPVLKRKVSYYGHRDEDPGTPEPSRGSMRRDMKALLAGKYTMPPPPRKRMKLPLRQQQHPALNVVQTQAPVVDLESEDQAPAPAPAPVLVRAPVPIITSTRAPTPPETQASPLAPPLAAIPVPVPAPAPVLALPRAPTPARETVSGPDPAPIPASSAAPAITPGPAVTVTPTTLVELPVDILESPVSLSPPPTPTRPRKGRKKQTAITKQKPKPAPKPAPVTEDTGVTEATAEAAEEAASVIRESLFLNMPLEVRNHIYRHLLVSKNPIYVKQLWSQKARGNTRRSLRRRGAVPEKLFETETETLIDTRVLRLCRQAHLEGSRILYGENRFHYMLRDPRAVDAALGFSTFRVGPASSLVGTAEINFAKYCHLLRHMAVELEPNRTDKDHEKLLSRALEQLALADPPSSPTSSSRANPSASQIFLDTLTVTITPVRELRGRQKDGIPEVIKFFSTNSSALKALQRINTRSIRINVHVERPRGDTEESDDESDDDDDEIDNEAALIQRKEANNRRHLETTIDLRFCARYMNRTTMTYIRNPYHDKLSPFDEHVPELIAVYPDEMWANDHHVLAKRSMLGQRAEESLADLRGRLEAAWRNADKSVRDGLWEDHAVAEQRRRINRARYENKFDRDTLLFRNEKKRKGKWKAIAGDEDESGSSTDTDTDDDGSDIDEGGSNHNDDGATGGQQQSPRTPRKSLILTISKFGSGGFRAFRAN